MQRWHGCAGPLALAAVLFLVGCDGPRGDTCEPGAVEPCTCGDGGALGTRRCRNDGTDWEPCDCGGTDGDADGDRDGDSDDEVDADGDGPDADVDEEPSAGPLVLVSLQMHLVPEAVCDVDGDGTPDNSIATLGAELAGLFAAAFDAMMAGSFGPGETMAVHVPWIDDRASPTDADFTAAVYMAIDTDRPADSTDDASGEEPFYMSGGYLDPCGEPLRLVEGLTLDHGELRGGGGSLALPTEGGGAALVISEVRGTVSPFGEEFLLRACGYALVQELGDYPAMSGRGSDLTFLEMVLSGGAALGVPLIPGVQPDVDLDGDGLERFVVDADGHLLRCVDGDRAVIEGRDCWQVPDMADAFSITIDLEGTRARFAGRAPGWEYRVPGDCPDWPPAESFFDTIPPNDTSCAGLDEGCDPRSPSPCCDGTHRCSGADQAAYRCSAPCDPTPCDFGAIRGGCFEVGDGEGPVCRPVAARVGDDGCTLGEVGCTTVHGASESTRCAAYWEGPTCFERCETATEPCAETHWCVALPFEPGGVCTFWPGSSPE